MKRVENAQNDGGGWRGWFRGDFSNRFVTEDSDLSCDFNANRRVFLNRTKLWAYNSLYVTFTLLQSCCSASRDNWSIQSWECMGSIIIVIIYCFRVSKRMKCIPENDFSNTLTFKLVLQPCEEGFSDCLHQVLVFKNCQIRMCNM